MKRRAGLEVVEGLSRKMTRCTKILSRRRTGTVTVTPCSLLVIVFLFVFSGGVGQSQVVDRAPDTMSARVLACASCHGAEGEGTSDVYFPRLAGKPAGYLYNQLLAFRDGRRKYPPMNYLLEFLPDAYLKQIAEHFASLRPPFPAPAIPTDSKEIVARGDSSRRTAIRSAVSRLAPLATTQISVAWSPRSPV